MEPIDRYEAFWEAVKALNVRQLSPAVVDGYLIDSGLKPTKERSKEDLHRLYNDILNNRNWWTLVARNHYRLLAAPDHLERAPKQALPGVLPAGGGDLVNKED